MPGSGTLMEVEAGKFLPYFILQVIGLQWGLLITHVEVVMVCPQSQQAVNSRGHAEFPFQVQVFIAVAVLNTIA
ncbi:hypothetical protein FQZ97_1059330 [compost metagenome]